MKELRGESIITSVYKNALQNVQYLLIVIFLIAGIILNYALDQAGFIWKIGLDNNPYDEFIFLMR